MAEGDTILRIARQLDETLAGSRITARTPGARRPEGLSVDSIDGRTLERVESRGKHLLLHFEGGLALHSHLGMRGSWQVLATGERWRRPPSQAWIALATDQTEAVNFGGSTLRLVRETELRRDRRLAGLGPDLLADGFEMAWGAEALRRRTQRDTEIGEALLDQSVIAGVGNVFKSEGCWEARIPPLEHIGLLTDEELVRLVAETRRLMLEAAENGRHAQRVYRQTGRPCPRCGSAIQSRAQGDEARTTYWCPSCQPPARG
jgi:endonuclease VIII